MNVDNMLETMENGDSPEQQNAVSQEYPDTDVNSKYYGDRNLNPRDIHFTALIREDFQTHDKQLTEGGVWALFAHRFGNWRMSIRPRLLRFPFSFVYRLMYYHVRRFWGIDLSYTVRVGRRVRIWHHGGIVIGARSIGDDVHIRHNTTLGLIRRQDAIEAPWKLPIIENGVDIGTGACILGDVTIGKNTIIGANSVVVRSFPPDSTVFGVPARPVKMNL